MGEVLTELPSQSEVSEEKPVYYNMSSAARRLGLYPQKIVYAIAQEKLKLYQRKPHLIEETELFRYANAEGIEIPEES
jgi:hypothetical protein